MQYKNDSKVIVGTYRIHVVSATYVWAVALWPDGPAGGPNLGIFLIILEGLSTRASGLYPCKMVKTRYDRTTGSGRQEGIINEKRILWRNGGNKR